ncbi:hypothetical protein OAO55_00960 [Bacteroidales bacterium]|nr:hypothetical protein [Bacteroidales bacterium]
MNLVNKLPIKSGLVQQCIIANTACSGSMLSASMVVRKIGTLWLSAKM